MTRTISNKVSAKQGTAIFLDQLKKLRTPMIIFGIIAAFFTSVIFALCMVSNSGKDALLSDYMTTALSFFCIAASYMVFFLTAIFTLIYALRATSYLHNKRKADMIFPMPVRSSVMFFSKLLAAYAAAIVPALTLIGLIYLITLCSGGMFMPGAGAIFWTIPLGSAACVLFFGLMAICCGTTANTILTFLAICFAYPISMNFIRGAIKAFFIGIPLNFGDDFFLFKALNPFAAYDGVNVIYWLLFIIACVALELFLLRKRKSERAQTSYAFRLPCYMVEVLITFIAGMLMGTVFGMFKSFNIPFAGFVFGILLGGSTAFVICHLILFHGFARILKSLIFYGATVAAAIAFVAVCEFASPAFTSYVPDVNDIESAGYVSFSNNAWSNSGFNKNGFLDVNEAVPQSAGDYADSTNVGYILAEHQNVVNYQIKRSDSVKFAMVLFNPVNDLFNSLSIYDDSFGVAYKLKDGRTVSRYYSTTSLSGYYGLFTDEHFDSYSATANIDHLVQSKSYKQKYHPLYAVPFENITDLKVQVGDESFTVTNEADARKIYSALQSDGIEDETRDSWSYNSPDIYISFNYKNRKQKNNVFSLANNYSDAFYDVSLQYTRTLAALREAGILDKNNRINQDKFDTPEIVYSKGEELFLSDYYDNIKVPFDCIEKTYFGNRYFTNDAGDVLMFEANDGDLSSAYAVEFKVDKYEKQGGKDGVTYGKATVTADGKQETLRYLKHSDSEYVCPTMFFTDKVTDEQFNSIVKDALGDDEAADGTVETI